MGTDRVQAGRQKACFDPGTMGALPSCRNLLGFLPDVCADDGGDDGDDGRQLSRLFVCLSIQCLGQIISSFHARPTSYCPETKNRGFLSAGAHDPMEFSRAWISISHESTSPLGGRSSGTGSVVFYRSNFHALLMDRSGPFAVDQRTADPCAPMAGQVWISNSTNLSSRASLDELDKTLNWIWKIDEKEKDH